jgi:hypothetical protein
MTNLELIELLDKTTQKINDQGRIVDDRLLQRKKQIEAVLQEQRQLEQKVKQQQQELAQIFGAREAT